MMSSLSEQQWCPSSVQVTVQQARGLRIKGKSGTNDAYAVMQVGKEKFQTSVAEKSVAPVWKEEASFDLPPMLLQHGGGGGKDTLHVHVLHRALVGPDKLLGQAVINLLQLSEDTTRNKTEWFKLLDKSGKADKDRGEVLVDIQFMRNNMTASMFDLSAAGKSKSRLGKFKDKVRGKKKESDTTSNVVPSSAQVLTDSEEEGNQDGEVAAVKGEKKKKHKMKSLFSPKSNLQKNMSQSMSVLPGKNSSLNGSQSSGLNVDSSEGKKKFKFLKHKRSGSSDSKESSSGQQKQGAAEPSNLCINGSHVYCEEPPPRSSRIGSNFSLASSGHGSMEDVPESSPPSVDSLRAMRQYSPWTEEEEEEVQNTQEDVGAELRREEEEKIRMEEERRRKEEEEERRREEEERVRKQEEELERLAEEKRRQEEEERRRTEEERVKREEGERIRMEEEERRQQEEEERVRREEEHERLAALKRRQEEEERRRTEEERVKREEGERIRMEEEERRQQEEEERVRREEHERLAALKRRQEEEERRTEEERVRKEEEERIRREEEKVEEERRRQEEEERIRREEEEREEKRRFEEQERRQREEERIRMEEERAEEERRRQEEEERARRQDEEVKLAGKRMLEEQERRRKEEEERIRMEEEKAEEERRRQEEEETARRQEEEGKLARKRRLEEQERRQREEEERIRMEEEKAEEERRRQEEEHKLAEEKRRLEEGRRIEEEKVKKEEEERIRREEERGEEERRRREEEDMMRRQEEEREEKRKLEEEERKRIEAEEKIRREEEERIRVEEERRKEEEEERVRRQLAEEKRILEEQERRRIEEEERKQREEEEMIRKEQERRREEEERARKEKEERLVEEKMRQQEQERRRIEEEEKMKREEEERIRREEKAEKERKEKEARKLEKERIMREEQVEKERKEEEARKLEKEKLKREAEEQKKKETKLKAAGKKVSVENPTEVTSTNPFDENFSNNPFEEIPDSSVGPDGSTAKVSSARQRVQPAASLLGNQPVTSDENDPSGTQRERRLAPQPPGRDKAEKQSQDGSIRHLAQINKKNKDKDVKTVSVPPQRSVQMIAPLSRSPTDTKNTQSLTQSSATKETNGAKPSKRPAPSRPRSVDEAPSSEHKTAPSSGGNVSCERGPEAKQVPIVYGLNPFDDDEDENPTQAADKDDTSQTKIKSSKARAPPLPVKKAATSSTLINQNTEGDHVTDDDVVTDNSVTHACDPKSEAVHVQESPLQESQPAVVQRAAEEAGGKKEVPPVATRRLQPVKPLNPLEQQSVSVVQGEKDNKSAGILQEKTKVNDTGLKGPYSQLTREELISLVLKQEAQLSERDKKISHLEQYIDNLLVRVMEEKPSILMSLNSLKAA